jgi:hypothetical protein
MFVASFDAGRYAGGVDRRLYRRAVNVVFVERYFSPEIGEAAVDSEKQHPGAELNGGVLGVNGPNSCGALRADCLWLHPKLLHK